MSALHLINFLSSLPCGSVHALSLLMRGDPSGQQRFVEWTVFARVDELVVAAFAPAALADVASLGFGVQNAGQNHRSARCHRPCFVAVRPQSNAATSLHLALLTRSPRARLPPNNTQLLGAQKHTAITQARTTPGAGET